MVFEGSMPSNHVNKNNIAEHVAGHKQTTGICVADSHCLWNVLIGDQNVFKCMFNLKEGGEAGDGCVIARNNATNHIL